MTRLVVFEIGEDEITGENDPRWRWTNCGHTCPATLPKPGMMIAVGNNDPCPVCEGGEEPRAVPLD